MTRQPDAEGEHYLDVRIDSTMADVDLDETLTITLPAWQWIALEKLAEHHDASVEDIVCRWVHQRLDRLVTHVDASPPG